MKKRILKKTHKEITNKEKSKEKNYKKIYL